MDEYQLIFADIIRTTKKAVLLDIDEHEYWVPRSVIQDGDSVSEFYEVSDWPQSEFWIKTWFCETEGLL